MAELRQRMAVEFENIERVLSGLPAGTGSLSTLELAGVGALLHSFYNGIENALAQIMRAHGVSLPSGPSWHRELVDAAVAQGFLSAAAAQALRPYLAFRRFFSHAYVIDTRADVLDPLVRNVRDTYALARENLERWADAR